MKPETSILIPAYNNGRFLMECIGSILRQDYQDYEIVIIDDHSTDNTENIVKSLMVIDDRIKYYHNERGAKGLVSALNYGIGLCLGEYIARMDADDMMIGQRLSEQVRYLRENLNVAGVSSSMELVDEMGSFLRKVVVNDNEVECRFMLLFCNMYVHAAMTIRKKILEEYKYDERYAYCEDYELWSRITSNYIIKNFKNVHHCYRIHESSTRKEEGLRKQQMNILKVISKKLDFYCIAHDECELMMQYSFFNSLNPIGSKEEIERWLNKVFDILEVHSSFDKKFLDHKRKSLAAKFQ